MTAEEYVEGVYVRFRDISSGVNKYSIATVLNAGATSYTVTNLRKFTKYHFFLVPFFKTVEGQPSNSKVVQTLEDGKYFITGLKTKLFFIAKYEYLKHKTKIVYCL